VRHSPNPISSSVKSPYSSSSWSSISMSSPKYSTGQGNLLPANRPEFFFFWGSTKTCSCLQMALHFMTFGMMLHEVSKPAVAWDLPKRLAELAADTELTSKFVACQSTRPAFQQKEIPSLCKNSWGGCERCATFAS
jgi:hypothetical protein